jgi:hypothetical protein
MRGYPYTSWIALISIIIVLASMPFIPGQGVGLVAGIVMVVIYSLIYYVMRISVRSKAENLTKKGDPMIKKQPALLTEFSQELNGKIDEKEKSSQTIYPNESNVVLSGGKTKKDNDEMFEEEEREREGYDG